MSKKLTARANEIFRAQQRRIRPLLSRPTLALGAAVEEWQQTIEQRIAKLEGRKPAGAKSK
jgi:hypothetical protein